MDIGVDFGPYTLTALSQGAGFVYAIEPRQKAIDMLIENIKLNPEFLNRILIIKKAVSDISFDTISIVDSNLSSRGSDYVSKRYTRQVEKEEPVLTMTVDDIVQRHSIQKLDWIKIDVEGMEDKVLLGAENTLIHLKPRIMVENHGTKQEIKNHKYLTSIGYELIFKNKEMLYNLFSDNRMTQAVYHHLFEPVRY